MRSGQVEGLLVMIECLIARSTASQGFAEVYVDCNEIGLDFQGPAVLDDGLVELSAAGECRPRLLWASAKAGLISTAWRKWAMASSILRG